MEHRGARQTCICETERGRVSIASLLLHRLPEPLFVKLAGREGERERESCFYAVSGHIPLSVCSRLSRSQKRGSPQRQTQSLMGPRVVLCKREKKREVVQEGRVERLNVGYAIPLTLTCGRGLNWGCCGSILSHVLPLVLIF